MTDVSRTQEPAQQGHLDTTLSRKPPAHARKAGTRLEPSRRPLFARLLAPDVAAGVLVAVALMLAAGFAAAQLSPHYEATASVIVLPQQDLPPDQVASYYDTLSQGQVVGTFAEVLRVRADATATPRDGARGTGTSIRVEAVPDTAVIRISATARTRQAAEAAADGVLRAATPYLNQFYRPYRVAVASEAAGTAQRTGVGRASLLAVVTLVALILGVAVQQAVRRLLTSRPAADPGTSRP